MRRALRFGLHGQDGATSRQSEAAKGEACGLLVKDTSLRDLRRLSTTLGGAGYLSGQLTGGVLNGRLHSSPLATKPSILGID
jgi:hypothetical protein